MHTEFTAHTVGTRVKRDETDNPQGVLLSMSDATGNTLLVRVPWNVFDESMTRFFREKAVETAKLVAPVVTNFLNSVDEQVQSIRDQASIVALDIYQAFGIKAGDVKKAEGNPDAATTEKELHAASGRSVGDALAV